MRDLLSGARQACQIRSATWFLGSAPGDRESPRASPPRAVPRRALPSMSGRRHVGVPRVRDCADLPDLPILERMSAATLLALESAASPRLLAVVEVADGNGGDDRESPLDRLAAALGRDFADRLVETLSTEALGRLESALTRDFADRVAEVAKERGEIQ